MRQTNISTSMREAFTLIELLVVISIISLLIAILLPALETARGAGKQSLNISNLRQIMFSMYVYAGDNKSSLPCDIFDTGVAGHPEQTFRNYYSAKLLAKGYLTDPFIFWGPFRNTTWFAANKGAIAQDPEGYAGTVYKFSGYSANPGAMASLLDTWVDGNNVHPRRLGGVNSNYNRNLGVANPPESKTLVLTEGFNVANYNNGTSDGWYMLLSPFSLSGSYTEHMYTYRGTAARAYMDGHATASKCDDLYWQADDDRNGSWYLPAARWEPWYERK